MSSPNETAALSVQKVTKDFVHQYYYILEHSPENLYHFYEESSTISRPDSPGVMASVTTIQGQQAITDMVLSLDYYKDCRIKIATVESQPSFNDAVAILVTGSLTGPENFRSNFCQTFFLTYKGKGVYFVLNDMFRFVGETQPKETNQMALNGSTNDVSESALISGPDLQEMACIKDHHMKDIETPPSEGGLENGDKEKVDEQVLSVLPSSTEPSSPQPVSKVTCSMKKEGIPKMSYALIVKSKGSTLPSQTNVPTTKAGPNHSIPKKSVTEPEKPLAASTKAAPKTEASATEEGHSIFITNLPLNITVDQVAMEFKKFGSIKPHGIQVRVHKVVPFCFGFVEFESKNSMQDAITASPVTVAGRQAYVEAKRTTPRVRNDVANNGFGGSRSNYPPGSQARNNNFRHPNRGFDGKFGFGRRDFRNHDNNTASGMTQEVQPRVFQNGDDRMGRAGPSTRPVRHQHKPSHDAKNLIEA